MIAIGDTIRRDGETYRVVGISEGEWVAQPLEFGTPIRLSARELAAFGVEASNPRDPRNVETETAGWERLKDEAEAARERPAPEAPTPEEIFEAVAIEEEETQPSERPTARRKGIDQATAARLGHRKG